MIIVRFEAFKNTQNPIFKPYLPGSNDTPDDDLMDMNLESCLADFREERKQLITLLDSFSEENWKNEGKHPEYKQFNPEIFLRHVMMHDHLHMYRIEQLWLTNDSYLYRAI